MLDKQQVLPDVGQAAGLVLLVISCSHRNQPTLRSAFKTERQWCTNACGSQPALQVHMHTRSDRASHTQAR